MLSMSSPYLFPAMASATTGKFTVARAAVILFSASLMGGFIWYSHIKAQPANTVTVREAATTRQTILPGSKRANVAIAPDDIKLLENGAVDLNLEATALVKGEGTPPPPTVILSGSKSFAGPLISTNQGVLTIGKGEKEIPTIQGSVDEKQSSSSHSQAIMGSSKGLSQMPIRTEELSKVAGKDGQPSAAVKGADAPAPAWNQNAPIFSSSKSSTVFKPATQLPAPVQAQAASPTPVSKTEAPTPAKKPEATPKPQAETPAPASP